MARNEIQVLNPMGYPPKINAMRMAERPESLDGKTVYLVDMRFDDSDLFLLEMQKWFAEHMPQVKTIFARKSGVHTQDDPELFQEIKEKGDAAILGVGH